MRQFQFDGSSSTRPFHVHASNSGWQCPDSPPHRIPYPVVYGSVTRSGPDGGYNGPSDRHRKPLSTSTILLDAGLVFLPGLAISVLFLAGNPSAAFHGPALSSGPLGDETALWKIHSRDPIVGPTGRSSIYRIEKVRFLASVTAGLTVYVQKPQSGGYLEYSK